MSEGNSGDDGAKRRKISSKMQIMVNRISVGLVETFKLFVMQYCPSLGTEIFDRIHLNLNEPMSHSINIINNATTEWSVSPCIAITYETAASKLTETTIFAHAIYS